MIRLSIFYLSGCISCLCSSIISCDFCNFIVFVVVVQQCRRPADPQNGDVVSRNKNQVLFKAGEKVWFKCDNGFNLVGAKDFVCQRNGNWLPQPFPRCVRRGEIE